MRPDEKLCGHYVRDRMAEEAAGRAEPPAEAPAKCEWCRAGWPKLHSISKAAMPRHGYPEGYKGMRAGYPYCTAEPPAGVPAEPERPFSQCKATVRCVLDTGHDGGHDLGLDDIRDLLRAERPGVSERETELQMRLDASQETLTEVVGQRNKREALLESLSVSLACLRATMQTDKDAEAVGSLYASLKQARRALETQP